MKLIAKGAEAELYREKKNLVKRRVKKGYRHFKIDEMLRRKRTKSEIKILRKAAAVVDVPVIIKEGKYEFEEEFLEGPKLKEVVEKRPGLCRGLGEIVGRLHAVDIIHGDITTSNVIVRGKKLYLIDFGLSFISTRIEDKATDLHLFRQVLNSTHPEVAAICFEHFLAGYRNYEGSDKVLKRLEKVEQRGRYK